jgi:hypothetical protein
VDIRVLSRFSLWAPKTADITPEMSEHQSPWLHSGTLTNVGITADEKEWGGQLGWRVAGIARGEGIRGRAAIAGHPAGAGGAHWSEGVSRSFRALGSQAEQCVLFVFVEPAKGPRGAQPWRRAPIPSGFCVANSQNGNTFSKT